MPLFTYYFSCSSVVQSSLAQSEADVVFSVYSSLHFQKSNSITPPPPSPPSDTKLGLASAANS